MINPHPVFEIKWIPGSTNLFIASHGDGTLVVYDKEKEDAVFSPEQTDSTPISYDKPRLQVFKSVQSQVQKVNPVAFWRVSTQRLNAFAFSPDGRYIAAGTEAGRLFIIDHHSERVLDVFVTFFGGIQAICWSPDGRYILFGGQDDMVSIISFDERELVARFQGHDSWVTHVAFDPWRCDGRNYRFGSVADDRRLLLWDFNASMLQRPRAVSNIPSLNCHVESPILP
jgi:WD40 repeat protein